MTFDAGDWFIGSLFDDLAVSHQTPSIPQLQYFHDAKYDAIIFGNHEFDRLESGLFTMLDKANKLQLNVNVIVSNLSPLPVLSKFNQFYDPKSFVKFLPFHIKETDTTKVGVLGYVTPDALWVSGDCRKDLQFVGFSADRKMLYNDLLDLATKQSSRLKEEEKCDLVVVIIHGGHREKEDLGFMSIPDVDIVVGGHSHEAYFYSSADSTLTSQCGSNGMYLTAVSVGADKDGKLRHRGVLEEYNEFVDINTPQCIKVDNKFANDARFEEKIRSWRHEFTDVLNVDINKIVFSGNLSHIFQNSFPQTRNAVLFAHMFLEQFLMWEASNAAEYNGVSALFWHKDLLEDYIVTHDSTDVTITYGDAYNLMHTTGTKNFHVFYISKAELYYTMQGVFVLNKLISPLMSLCPGGVEYDEMFYFGIPIITNLRTNHGLPYSEWPTLVRIATNSMLAKFFWTVDSMTHGLVANFPKDKHGLPVSFEDTYVPDSPTELDLFFSHLQHISS